MLTHFLALAGLILLVLRLWPRGRDPRHQPVSWPKVSLIIPARNEEVHLPLLLDSLMALDYPDLEIIIVDDNSQDRTALIAKQYPVQLIVGTPKPEGWFGKTWACHQASLIATGELFLFTDADTTHRPQSLKIAVAAFIEAMADGLTALPYHRNPKLWERLVGPFQLLLSAVTNPYGAPRKGRVFAIGQYLLFERGFYERIGGHREIKAEAVDDLALAGKTLEAGGMWHVHTGSNLYDVHMYNTLNDFIKGWRRNFRGGMQYNSPMSFVEVLLFFMAMTAGLEGTPLTLTISGLTLLLLAFTQNKIGRFSMAGIFLLPFPIALFTWISILTIYDKILLRPLLWKSRSYTH